MKEKTLFLEEMEKKFIMSLLLTLVKIKVQLQYRQDDMSEVSTITRMIDTVGRALENPRHTWEIITPEEVRILKEVIIADNTVTNLMSSIVIKVLDKISAEKDSL